MKKIKVREEESGWVACVKKWGIWWTVGPGIYTKYYVTEAAAVNGAKQYLKKPSKWRYYEED